MATIEDAERLAERMRSAYCGRRRLVTRHYNPNHRDDVHWTNLAKLLIDRNIDGIHYVNWIYDFYTFTRPAAYPRQITSTKSVRIYMEKASYKPAQREQEVCVNLNIQFEVVRQRLSFGEDLRTILSDESLELGAVVRYVLSHHGDFTDLASGFRAEAEREVRLNPYYKKIMGDKLPLGGG